MRHEGLKQGRSIKKCEWNSYPSLQIYSELKGVVYCNSIHKPLGGYQDLHNIERINHVPSIVQLFWRFLFFQHRLHPQGKVAALFLAPKITRQPIPAQVHNFDLIDRLSNHLVF